MFELSREMARNIVFLIFSVSIIFALSYAVSTVITDEKARHPFSILWIMGSALFFCFLGIMFFQAW